MKKIIIPAAVLLLAALAGYRFVATGRPGRAGPGAEEVPAVDAGESAPVRVRAVAARAETIERVISATGTVRARAAVHLVPEAAGVLESFALPDGTPVREGARLEKGQVVARLERRHLAAQLREAETRLESALAARGETLVYLEDSEREYGRMSALYREEVIARREFDRVKTALDAAVSRVGQAEEHVNQASASLESVRLRYRDADVVSPVSGIVSERLVDEGAHVSPQTPLARLLDIDSVDVVAAVPERHLPAITPGRTPVIVRPDALPGREFPGRVTRVSPEVDPSSRTVELTVAMENPGHLLRPGMFARLEVVVERRAGVTVIPDSALAWKEAGDEVFLVTDGLVARRGIRTGLRVGGRSEVRAGLRPGDRVVISGHHLLSEGTAVEVVPEEEGR